MRQTFLLLFFGQIKFFIDLLFMLSIPVLSMLLQNRPPQIQQPWMFTPIAFKISSDENETCFFVCYEGSNCPVEVKFNAFQCGFVVCLLLLCRVWNLYILKSLGGGEQSGVRYGLLRLDLVSDLSQTDTLILIAFPLHSLHCSMPADTATLTRPLFLHGYHYRASQLFTLHFTLPVLVFPVAF